MALAAGVRLGPYEIVSLVGAGGMGEVYKARDTRLGRTVAIKITNEEFSNRFEHEARAIAALNHPHVCTLYDVGPNYLVTEFLEGETLGDWLKHAPSIETRLETAKQVLEALCAAHDAGVVHRDLKPANIMIRPNGYVKVLDFGLAKQIPDSGGLDDDSTATLGPTAPGQLLGTAAYMSPEQIRSQEVDHRSDLFSFGIIFYEILTGRHPWRRQFQVDTLHAIIHDDLPPLPAGSISNPGIIIILQKLLRKKPPERYQSASAVLEALSGTLENVHAARGTPLPDPPEILSRKAQDLLIRFGYTEPPADRESWFELNPAYITWAFRHLSPQQFRDQVRNGQPAAVNFRYRQSRHTLPSGDWQDESARLRGLPSVPPPSSAGDADLRVDPQGHLVYLHVVSPVPNKGPIGGSPSWALLLEAAGLDPAHLIATEPQHVPLTGFDTRSAWTGTYTHAPTMPLRIEAASWQGQPVFFQVTGPWSQTDSELPPGQPDRVRMIQALLYYSGLALASFLAWRHSRSGRGDTRAAGRLAAAIFLCNALATLLLRHRAPDSGYLGLDSVAGSALVLAITTWVFYMALEPYVRRRWPQSLISWTRLVNHGPKDPLVAGHVLIGIALGMLFAILVQLGSLFARQHGEIGMGAVALPLQGIAASISTWLYTIGVAYLSLLVLFSVFLLHALTRRTWITALICMVASAFLIAPGGPPGVFFWHGFGSHRRDHTSSRFAPIWRAPHDHRRLPRGGSGQLYS